MKSTDINALIESHMPFIINTISKLTNKYVSIENDEELSVALLAFNEAVNKYSDERGPFLPFAKLVITSRLKNYFKKENKNYVSVSLENLEEEGIQISEEIKNPVDNKDLLIDEIEKLKEEIDMFGFNLEDLVDEAPKHSDTRKRAINISENISEDENLTSFMYSKKRLPIKQISLKYSVTEKIIKGSKKFITTGVIIFYKNFRNLKLWIKGR
ncbi:MAG: RNA polymerase subunit sigma [Peptostreptococcaceae bacterium]